MYWIPQKFFSGLEEISHDVKKVGERLDSNFLGYRVYCSKVHATRNKKMAMIFLLSLHCIGKASVPPTVRKYTFLVREVALLTVF